MITAKKITDFSVAEPAIQEKNFWIHYSKHYLKYVDTVNELMKPGMEDLSIRQMINQFPIGSVLYNNAAQVFNHEFFFEQFTGNVNSPSEQFMDLLYHSGYDSFTDFVDDIIEQGSKLFGSGYIWVIERFGTLRVVTSENAINFAHNKYNKYILTIDLWEHSYYLDYLNDKKQYIKNILHCIDWDVISKRLWKD